MTALSRKECEWVFSVVLWGLFGQAAMAFTQPCPASPLLAVTSLFGAYALGLAAGAWVNWGWRPWA